MVIWVMILAIEIFIYREAAGLLFGSQFTDEFLPTAVLVHLENIVKIPQRNVWSLQTSVMSLYQLLISKPPDSTSLLILLNSTISGCSVSLLPLL